MRSFRVFLGIAALGCLVGACGVSAADSATEDSELAAPSGRTRSMTITSAAGSTPDTLRASLKDAGYKMTSWADAILGRVVFPEQSETLDLVGITSTELGFSGNATRGEIYQRAEQRGYGLCPSWVGPVLRLAYADQPMDEGLLIGMEPLPDSQTYLHIFLVGGHEGSLWLHANFGYDDHVWGPETAWVFVQPKVQPK